MFQVNWSAKHFGFIGLDVFIDDKLKDTIPNIAQLIEKEVQEPVIYKIIDL